MLIKLIVIILVVMLTSCGNNGGDSGTGNTINISGVAVDGAIQNGQVFIDRNGNGLYDNDGSEFPSPVVTNSSGHFSYNYSGGNGVLTVRDGIDQTTNAPFRGVMRFNLAQQANGQQVVLSPLSSLANNLTATQADRLFNGFGTSLNEILTTDYISGRLPDLTAQANVLILSVYNQKLVELLSEASVANQAIVYLSMNPGATMPLTSAVTSFSSSIQKVIANELARSLDSMNGARFTAGDLIDNVRTSSLVTSVIVTTNSALTVQLIQKISTFTTTIRAIGAATTDTRRVLLAGELLSRIISTDPFSLILLQRIRQNPLLLNIDPVALAHSAVVTNDGAHLLTTDSQHLIDAINNSTVGSTVDSLVQQSSLTTFPSITTDSRVILRGSELVYPDSEISTSGVAVLFFSPIDSVIQSGAAVVCLSIASEAFFTGRWHYVDSSNIQISSGSFIYRLASVTSPESNFARVVSSNIPSIGGRTIRSVTSVRVRETPTAEDFTAVSSESIPTSAVNCTSVIASLPSN